MEILINALKGKEWVLEIKKNPKRIRASDEALRDPIYSYFSKMTVY